MSFKSKMKIDDAKMFVSFIFYAVTGIIYLVILPWANFPPQIGIIAILSILTAYGILKKRMWAVWLVVILFFVATVFSVTTLYYYFGKDLLLSISVIIYLILMWVFTAYAVARRKIFEH